MNSKDLFMSGAIAGKQEYEIFGRGRILFTDALK